MSSSYDIQMPSWRNCQIMADPPDAHLCPSFVLPNVAGEEKEEEEETSGQQRQQPQLPTRLAPHVRCSVTRCMRKTCLWLPDSVQPCLNKILVDLAVCVCVSLEILM